MTPNNFRHIFSFKFIYRKLIIIFILFFALFVKGAWQNTSSEQAFCQNISYSQLTPTTCRTCAFGKSVLLNKSGTGNKCMGSLPQNARLGVTRTPCTLLQAKPPQTNDKEEEFVLFIVDFSNSMTEKLHGTKKINMVLDTMQELLPQIPPNQRVGLRVYGHKGGYVVPGLACKASSLIVPMVKNSAAQIQSALFSLKPTGWTPITYSLKQAVNSDFAGVKGKKRIILLTDGGENCDESPCDYVLELTKTRQDIYIDVIAFNIYDQEANNQLKCTALVTQGKFYSANTAAELMQSLKSSLNAQKEVQGVIITH